MTGPAPEPTTAEAFATIRANIPAGCIGSLRLLALLERRMGLLWRACRLDGPVVCQSPEAGQTCLELGWTEEDQACEVCRARHVAALTDAPPIFTLEEVEEVLTEAGLGATTVSLLARDLSGRRR